MVAYAARYARPISSDISPYSRTVSPDSCGENRFHSPSDRAAACSSSSTGGSAVQRSAPCRPAMKSAKGFSAARHGPRQKDESFA